MLSSLLKQRKQNCDRSKLVERFDRECVSHSLNFNLIGSKRKDKKTTKLKMSDDTPVTISRLVMMLGNVQHENFLQMREMIANLGKKSQSMENVLVEIKQKLDESGTPNGNWTNNLTPPESSIQSTSWFEDMNRLIGNGEKFLTGGSDEEVPEKSESKSMGKVGFVITTTSMSSFYSIFHRDFLLRLSA